MRDKKVAILESRLGQQMIDLVAKRGGVPIHAPALAEVADVDPTFVARLIDDIQKVPAKLAIFQTGVGTRALFAATDALGATDKLLQILAATTIAVRGPKPTAALRARNVRIDVSARDPFTTHEVLEAVAAIPIESDRVIVQRYGVTNVELEEALKARGAEVIEIPTYRWAVPDNTRPLTDLMDALARREVDAVAFTNAAQVHNLFAVAKPLGRVDALRSDLGHTLIASIGPVASHALREFGLTPSIEASPPKLGPLISALDEALSR
ncbi:MAG TPA: uroporphyrinogen-III synthase [Casimicrobiaceae bacterium]|jgi:uroporphyrinogen-III synthase